MKFCFAQFIEKIRSLYIEDSRMVYIGNDISETLGELVGTLAFLFFIKNSVFIERWKIQAWGYTSKYFGSRNIQTGRLLIWQTYYDYLWNDTRFFNGYDPERSFLVALCDKRDEEARIRDNQVDYTEVVSVEKSKFRKYCYVMDIIQDFMKDFAHILTNPSIDEFDRLIDRYREERCFKDDQEWIEELNEIPHLGEDSII